jgi:hypothetical protein
MTWTAVAAIEPRTKLAPVLIAMTVEAARVREVRAEIRRLVAFCAFKNSMFAGQREFRSRMTELALDGDGPPRVRVVTTVATRGKGLFVRIGVAGGAVGERDSPEANDPRPGCGPVAFGTVHLLVTSCEGERRARVVEFSSRLPVFDVMAAGAFVAELRSMHVLMTACAGGGQSEECRRQVFNLDGLASRSRDVTRGMAALACKASMFAS